MTCNSDARRRYKAQAKSDIRTKFWPTMGAVILENIPLGLIGMILLIGVNGLSDMPTMAELLRLYQYMGIYIIAIFLIGAPITFGAKHYFVSRARGEESSVSQIFICFTGIGKYITSLKLSLCIAIRSLGWIVLLYVIILVGTMLIVFALYAPGVLAVLAILVIVAVIVAVSLFAAVKIRRYDGAYICMIDTPDASVWEAVKACAPIFKGHNWELLIFDLSFILWELASVCTLGIVGIYTNAYTEITFVHYFDDLCGKNIQQPTEMPEL